ncbi:MAG: ribulose-phosphate 3-epimerase [Campylobacteraceae bacterium]|jgi:ribulose-phosphate 3-epimerase|nr:ribulose-phosphate 3-epimerase [Campylobacteraceae bacterium]
MLVAPSILSANFGKLDEEIRAVCDDGCDLVHVDVMDGHFVPNLTIGPVVVQAAAHASSKPLDIHLMVENNTFFIELFAPIKPKYLSFHIEEERHPHRLIQKIRSYGISPAIVLNPHSSLKTIEYILEELDMALLMSVNPGFGGQSFIRSSLKKVEKLRKMIDGAGLKTLIEVDGGVNSENARDLKNAGADILVAGSYIFGSSSYKNAIDSLRA